MLLLPAIDLLNGKVVRLRHGRYDDATYYPGDALEHARRYQEEGAHWLHLVDLSAAQSGAASQQQETVMAILELGLSVQLGGGIRTQDDAEKWLQIGVSRVVLGTAALADPNMVRTLCEHFPSQIVVAVDSRNGRVAVEGWEKTSDVDVEELALQAEKWGAAALLFTDIARDGGLSGPAVENTATLQRSVAIPVIASGGISSLHDLSALQAGGVQAAVCGKALLENRFAYRDALLLSGVVAS